MIRAVEALSLPMLRWIDPEDAHRLAIRGLKLTRILIAHRPETIASASRVIVLQGGRVAQDLRQAA